MKSILIFLILFFSPAAFSHQLDMTLFGDESPKDNKEKDFLNAQNLLKGIQTYNQTSRRQVTEMTEQAEHLSSTLKTSALKASRWQQALMKKAHHNLHEIQTASNRLHSVNRKRLSAHQEVSQMSDAEFRRGALRQSSLALQFSRSHYQKFDFEKGEKDEDFAASLIERALKGKPRADWLDDLYEGVDPRLLNHVEFTTQTLEMKKYYYQKEFTSLRSRIEEAQHQHILSIAGVTAEIGEDAVRRLDMDEAFGLRELGQSLFSLATMKEMLSTAVSFSPLAMGQSACNAFWGVDIITKRKLSNLERSLEIVSVATLGFGGVVVKGAKAVGGVLRKWPGGKKGLEVAVDGAYKIIDSASKHGVNSSKGMETLLETAKDFKKLGFKEEIPALLELTKNWKKTDAFHSVAHVIKGDITNAKKLKGGLHTKMGLENFFKVKPGLEKATTINKLPNGVKRVTLPKEAFNSQGWKATVTSGNPGGKTLFPDSWGIRKITDSTNKVLEDKNITGVGREGFEKVVDGVKIRAQLFDGKVISAFPTWVQ